MEPLARKLGVFDVFCVAAGAMISSGLFVLPAIIYAYAGPSVIIAYFLASLLVVPSMLSEIELATAMPRAGGSYFFIERSMGQVLGLFGGLGSWFAIALKAAFAIVGMAAMATGILSHFLRQPLSDLQSLWLFKAFGVIFVLAFMTLNIRSVKHTGRFQAWLVVILIAILLAFVAIGSAFCTAPNFTPFFREKGFLAILAATGTVFVSFGGLTKTCSIAEEVEDSSRKLPLGMFLAWLVVSALYVAVVTVTVGVTSGDQLEGSLRPIQLAAGVFLGLPGAIILGIAALAAFMTTANAGTLTASRIPMAMSRDHLLPDALARVNKKLGTPVTSIALTSGFMILAIVALDVERLVKTASTLLIMTYILENASVIVMRASRIQSYQPRFRSPLFPFPQAFAIVIYVALIIDMGFIPLMVASCFIILSAFWYFVYARQRVWRDSAIAHIITRVTDKEFRTPGLEQELLGILFERDNIIEDRFDELIRNCMILDLDGKRSSDSVFREVAGLMADRIGSSPDELYEKLIQREAEGSTVIQKGLAIPHIVIGGQNKFEILIVRNRDGITFPGLPDPVHAVFILAGTKDERNYHLRALMAIAQIAQHKQFEERWLKAPDIQSLRNMILLAKRRRDTR